MYALDPDSFRALFIQAPVGMVVLDEDLRQAEVNPALLRCFGLNRRDLQGRNILDCLPERDRDSFRNRIFAVARGEREADLAIVAYGPDAEQRQTGTVRMVRLRGAEAGSPVLLLFDGLGAQQRAERALETRDAQLRRIIDLVPHMIHVKNWDGCFLLVNQATATAFGTTVDRLTGSRMAAGGAVGQPDDRAMAIDREVMRSGQADLFREESFRDANGRVRTLETSRLPYPLPGKSRPGVLVVAVDASDRKALERRLRDTLKAAALGKLAGRVSHDFNNLLTVIGSTVECMLLDAAPGTQALQEDLRSVQEAAQRGRALTRQLIELGREQVSVSEQADLTNVLGQLRPLLLSVLGEAVQVRLSGLKRVHTVGLDPVQVEQVVYNLVLNSSDAMREGGELELTIDTEVPAPGPGRFVCLVVRDTGVGMTPETLDRIFEPFFTTKETDRSSGLGLTTVRELLDAAGGHVRAESELGVGTTVRAWFPAVGQEAEEEPAPPPSGQVVLVVDDQVQVRRLIRRSLERHGFVIHEAVGGAEALEAWGKRAHELDLLLTDVVMPQMDGTEVALGFRRVRSDLPVLYISGYPGDSAGPLRRVGPADSFLAKPFSVDELTQAVRHALGSRVEPA